MEKKNISKLGLVAIAVIRSMPSGYRRAGFALENGETELAADNCTLAQLEALEKDSRLAVKRIEASESDKGQSTLDAGNLANGLSIDDAFVLAAPDELKPFVAAIIERGYTSKPNCDDLKVEIPGDGEEAQTIKPSAEQRNTAWSIVEAQLNANKQGDAE